MFIQGSEGGGWLRFEKPNSDVSVKSAHDCCLVYKSDCRVVLVFWEYNPVWDDRSDFTRGCIPTGVKKGAVRAPLRAHVVGREC